MGREVVEAVLAADMNLVGAADPTFADMSIKDALGLDSSVVIQKDLHSAISSSDADVVVVFTVPSSAMENIRIAMENGVAPVVGTTGITPENLAEIRNLSERHGVGAIIAPNFAIGAILMMKMAGEVAKYLPAVEIIELHHDRKLDAPSGTSIKTAELIASARQEEYLPKGDLDSGARGAEFGGVRIHSVRLPGFIAHQEVIFGGLGQSLTIRHDSYDRKSFMPGVLLAIRKAHGLKSVVYGLENII